MSIVSRGHVCASSASAALTRTRRSISSRSTLRSAPRRRASVRRLGMRRSPVIRRTSGSSPRNSTWRRRRPPTRSIATTSNTRETKRRSPRRGSRFSLCRRCAARPRSRRYRRNSSSPACDVSRSSPNSTRKSPLIRAPKPRFPILTGSGLSFVDSSSFDNPKRSRRADHFQLFQPLTLERNVPSGLVARRQHVRPSCEGQVSLTSSS
jgi:hypothetical protein